MRAFKIVLLCACALLTLSGTTTADEIIDDVGLEDGEMIITFPSTVPPCVCPTTTPAACVTTTTPCPTTTTTTPCPTTTTTTPCPTTTTPCATTTPPCATTKPPCNTCSTTTSRPVVKCPPCVNDACTPNACDLAVHLPFPGDCTKFCQCDHTGAVEFDCPAGLHFNPALQVCDWPFNNACTLPGTYIGSCKP